MHAWDTVDLFYPRALTISLEYSGPILSPGLHRASVMFHVASGDSVLNVPGTKALSCRETTMIVVLALLFLICTVLVVLVALQTGSSQRTSSIRDGARSKVTNDSYC